MAAAIIYLLIIFKADCPRS